MNRSDFDDYVKERLEEIVNLSCGKGKEYAKEESAFNNLEKGAKMDSISPEKCLWDYMRKHLVSIKDIIDEINEEGKTSKDFGKVKEKCGDVILYMILLEGIVKSRKSHS